jgi:hypothetical protein
MQVFSRKLLKIGTEGVWLPASRAKPIRSDLYAWLCPHLRLSCTPAGDVIQLLHEESHRTIARATDGGH